jgi:putative serine protease PepD
MTRTSALSLTAAVVAGACIGVGGGAATYLALKSDDSTTVVRQVTVSDSQPTANGALSVNEIYQRARKGVVEITVTQGSNGLDAPSGQAQGSGWVYDSAGHIITNEHVVENANSVSVMFWNGKKADARVVGTDPSTDLAVLAVDAPSSLLFPLSVGDSGALQVGDSVVAIGSPFGLEETVTAGIVSALHREMTSPNNFAIDDSIQTDAAINHGNSGGPLLNAQGKVVGVNSQIASDSGGSDGVGFAIPSDTVRSIARQLITNGKAQHAFLGVVLDDGSENGAHVAQVRGGSPAADAGLRAGDVITQVNGEKVDSSDELRAAINAHKPGDKVSLTYTRNGQSHTAEVTLASRPS